MIGTLISILLIAKCSWCIPLDQLYPFGADEGDKMLDPFSDLPVIIGENFNFDLNSRQELYVC